MSIKLKYKRIVLTRKTECGNVLNLVVDFGWVYPDQVQTSISEIRKSNPGWNLISCFAIKADQAFRN